MNKFTYYTLLLAMFLLIASNLLWYGQYRTLQYDLGRTDAYREWSDAIIRANQAEMPDARVYKIRKTDIGEARITCLNSGDATIRPVEEFGQIIVSCGK